MCAKCNNLFFFATHLEKLYYTKKLNMHILRLSNLHKGKKVNNLSQSLTEIIKYLLTLQPHFFKGSLGRTCADLCG